MQHAAVKEGYGILIHSERRRKYDESLRLRRLQARAAAPVLETAVQAVRCDGRRGLSKAAAGAPSAH